MERKEENEGWKPTGRLFYSIRGGGYRWAPCLLSVMDDIELMLSALWTFDIGLIHHAGSVHYCVGDRIKSFTNIRYLTPESLNVHVSFPVCVSIYVHVHRCKFSRLLNMNSILGQSNIGVV